MARGIEICVRRNTPASIQFRDARDSGKMKLRTGSSSAREADATLTRVANLTQAPRAVSDYLHAEGLAGAIVMTSDRALARIPWAQEPGHAIRQGVAGPNELNDDPVGVTGAVAGIAETGTVMVRFGPPTPNMLHFLAETHIVILSAGRLVGSYEDAFAILDRDRIEAGETAPPRAVTLITGPSRTGDIERELVIGVHGPRRFHIVLINGKET